MVGKSLPDELHNSGFIIYVGLFEMVEVLVESKW